MRARDRKRHQLGRFWLYQRPDTGTWFICWLDDSKAGNVRPDGKRGGAVTRRKATGIAGGGPDSPPQDALSALAAHHLSYGEERKLTRDEALVENIFADWLEFHVAELADPERYIASYDRWVEFLDIEKKAGRIEPDMRVAAVTPAFVQRFTKWRFAAGVGGHTVSRDLAALRGALRWAWKAHRLDAVPFIADVPAANKSGPRDRILSFAEIASIMELAAASVEREHVLRFMMVELGTAGRPEGVLEMHARNIDLDRGLIDPNRSGKRHLRKRRPIVPIAKHVRPWVEDVRGKLIVYRVPIAERKRKPGGPTHFVRETSSIKTSWNAICMEAGVREPAMVPLLDERGRPVKKDGEVVMTEQRDDEGEIVMRVNATPKTLRHTMLTWLASIGVPKEQRQMLAGHVAQDTTSKNYEHLTPDYLAEAIKGIDAFFEELSKHTKVHLRSVCDPHEGGLRVISGGKI
jgi:integrase